ncbi:hypothetical protein PAXRUDRAFT_16285 [Paxillus rubicundulus Ve08.2h10]|uniref:Uncharacterized protein n=1 Tax=Paxillus rubicundulus Ve08.2h10 TaxID=930991 RepID=A0A0D0CVQ6_9AGAM|nr:hypothetical protein PAXRUDRAFT_16285 [Paxillus rubicundulus Ve08.2h10]
MENALIECLLERDHGEISSTLAFYILIDHQSSNDGNSTSIDPHDTDALFPPISQLVVPAQPKPKNKDDFEATGHHAHPGDLVIPATPKTAGHRAIRPNSGHMSTNIDIPSGPKQACRISTTHQNLSTLVLPSKPKCSNGGIDSVRSMPGPSNATLAPKMFNEAEDIAMDYMDVDPIPSRINPAGKCFTYCGHSIQFID